MTRDWGSSEEHHATIGSVQALFPALPAPGHPFPAAEGDVDSTGPSCCLHFQPLGTCGAFSARQEGVYVPGGVRATTRAPTAPRLL